MSKRKREVGEILKDEERSEEEEEPDSEDEEFIVDDEEVIADSNPIEGNDVASEIEKERQLISDFLESIRRGKRQREAENSDDEQD